jgi:hypothetical protein
MRLLATVYGIRELVGRPERPPMGATLASASGYFRGV